MIRIAPEAGAAAVDAVTALLDAGTGPGYLELRTGLQPATADATATGTLLATLPLSDPAFGGSTITTPAVATANPVTPDAADATGTLGWFRAYDSTSTPVIDGTVTGIGGGGEMEIDRLDVTTGVVVTVASWLLAAHP